MTFVKQQNAVKPARSWGVLGLVLTLAMMVFGWSSGYGQRPADPLAAVTSANKELREKVASTILSVAEAAKIKPQVDTMVMHHGMTS